MNLQSEHIERAALSDLHRAAPSPLVERLRLQSRSIDTALVSIAGALPASAIVVNRTLGLGLEAPATQRGVQALVTAYRQAGVERYFVQPHPAARPHDLIHWLEQRGLAKSRGWQKFSRGRDAVPRPATELRIEEIGASHGEDFGRIVCDAFDLGDAAVPWLATLPGRRGWHVFMSFAGDEPAGAGAVFVKDGFGWTDFGATAPQHRRRGSQGALLARRVQCALDSGCTEIFTCTGEAVPGDPQHSFANIKKVGFRETYVRQNYAPPGR